MDAKRESAKTWRVLPFCLLLLALSGHRGAPEAATVAPRLLLFGERTVAAVDPTSLDSLPVAPEGLPGTVAGSSPATESTPRAPGRDGSSWTARGNSLVLANEVGHELTRVAALGDVAALSTDAADGVLWSVEGRSLVGRDLVSGAFLRRMALPRRAVTVRLAASPRSGSIWLATGGAAFVADPHGELRALELPGPVSSIQSDGRGAAWALVEGELVYLSVAGEGLRLPLPGELAARRWIDVEARGGVVWLTDGEVLARLEPDLGSFTIRRGLGGIRRLRLSTADRTPPLLEWDVPDRGPAPGAVFEVRLAVDEAGSGVAESGVRLAANGEALPAACRAAAHGSFVCRGEARYLRGRWVLEATVTDQAGNRSNRLHESWPEPGAGASAAPPGVRADDFPVTVVLPATGDTYLGLRSANRNEGSNRALSLRAGGFDRPLVRFDLAPAAPQIEALHSAHLELTIVRNGNDWGAGELVDIYRATAPWSELGATWNCDDDADTSNAAPDCAPTWWGGDHATEPTDSVLHTNDLGTRVTFDVTADVQGILEGQPNHGWPDHGWLIKRELAGSGSVRYASREYPTELGPQLRLVFEPVAPDETPPTVAFVRPAPAAVLEDDRPILEVVIADDESGPDYTTLAIEVNGVPAGSECLRTLGLFCSLDEPLPQGVVVLAATVEDLAGNVSAPAQITVTVAPAGAGPPPVNALLTSASEAAGGATTVTGLTAAAQPLTLLTATNPANGAEATTTVAVDGSFGLTLAAEPGDVLSLVLTDGAQLASPAVLILVPVPGACHAPPDPSLIAGQGAVLNFDLYEHSRFLWENEPPVQAGVAAGALTAANLALVRGRVRDRDGAPLPGVSISVLDGPDFGCTASRVDGGYELAFAGGTVVLQFAREGYFTSQRRMTLPFGRQRTLAEVVLTPMPETSTVVGSGQGQVQVARGLVEVDENGVRQPTLLVPGGVSAELELPDGSTQSAPSLTVRIREFTVGEQGPAAMPGTLPAASAYTHAFEATADEADAVGASIVFSEPVYHYVENYLDFPVGYPMPVGYYDKRAGVWVPSANGVVLELLAIDGAGRAEVDIDGSGQPAGSAALADLGFTDAERVELAQLYGVGDQLWRTPIPHLTPYDCNAPWIFSPADSIEPDPEVTAGGGELCNNSESGSIIECQNQVFRDAIPLAGTPFALHYSSERVPGREFGRSIEILLTPEEIPESLTQVVLEIEVVGRRFKQSFAPTPNLRFTFVWDGLDAYGRPVIGQALAEGRVGFVYPLDYGSPSGDPGFGLPPNSNVSVREALEEIVSWAEFSVTLESLSFGQTGGQLGLGWGGWSITPQHVHTPQARKAGQLHLGDGSRFPSRQPSAEDVELLAEHAAAYVWHDDAWVLVNASIPNITGLAVDPAGNLYFSTTHSYAVYMRTPEGVVYRVAGGSSATTWGDGVPAVTALLDRPERVTVGPDGSLYIVEVYGDRIRRIRPGTSLETRVIETVAELDGPMDVSIGPDGGLYTAVHVPGSGHKVLRVDLESGEIGSYAGGNGAVCSAPDRGDGGSALQACLILASSHVLRMAWMADGSLLLPEGGGTVHASRIRRVWPDGTITTFMGDDTQGDPSYGEHYSNSSLRNPVFVAVDPVTGHIAIVDGAVNGGVGRMSLIVEGDIIVLGGFPAADLEFGLNGNLFWARDPLGSHDTRVFERVLEGVQEADGTFRVPSPDGGEIYAFTAEGRHLETVDAYTGDLIHRFLYDPLDRLFAIEDRYGERVTIERDDSGYPRMIRAPRGQVTWLVVDGSGQLTEVTNPAGERWGMDYYPGGLLETLTNPRQHSKTLTYDDLGRLRTHVDAKGATKTLTRSAGTEIYDVTFTTAEGRNTVYAVHRNPDGSQIRTRTDPGDVVTETLLEEDLSRTETLPDGTRIDLLYGDDPRFGPQAPVPELTVTTPLGHLSRTTSVQRDVTLIDPAGSPRDPENLDSFTERVKINGKIYTARYTSAERSWLLTSPEGRTVTTRLNADGEVARIEQPGVEPVTMVYDDLGRLEERRAGTGAAERVVTLAYDPAEGWLDAVTDAEERTLGWQRDLVGRPEVTEYPDARVLRATFDAHGNLETLVPPSRPAHGFTYDAVDLPATYQAPGNPVETYAFNLDHQPFTVTLPSAETVTWHYDATRRLERLETSSDDHSFAYVPRTHQVQSIDHWPEGYQTGTPQTVTYSYDGFLPTSTAWSGPVTGTVSQSYDHDFRVANQFVNGLWSVSYAYDLDSLLTRAGSLSVARDPATGRIDGTTLGAVITTQGYNEFGELDAFGATTGASSLYSASYLRDRLGRIEQKTETVEGVAATYDYVYDPAGRLDTVHRNGALVEDYAYDGNDNRLSYDGTFGPATGAYDDQDRLQAYGGVNYSFDADGYLTSKSAGGYTTTYDYDAMGSLRKVVLDTGITVEYLVDGQNRRVGKLVDGVPVKGFLYQDQLNPVAELDAAGNVTARFVYGTRAHVPDYLETPGATYRLVTDHLGSVRLVVDTATGTIAQRIDYDSFGRITYDSNPGFQPFAFAGGLYDPQTGLVRFGARDYDSITGRWTAKDPIRFGGGDSNLFAYVAQDPVNLFDPSGLLVFESILQALADFSAGFGDTISFGLTQNVRQWLGVDHVVSSCSGFYVTGKVVGIAHGLALGTASSLNAGARSVFFSGRKSFDAATAGKGIGRMIGDTLGGKILTRLNAPAPVWRAASAVFAANAKGEAQLFLRLPLRPGSVFATTEVPTMRLFARPTLLMR